MQVRLHYIKDLRPVRKAKAKRWGNEYLSFCVNNVQLPPNDIVHWFGCVVQR